MPTIQQERGVKTVAGLPSRWGRRAYREITKELARGHEAANPDDLRAPLNVPAGFVGPLQLWYGPLERVPSRYDSLCKLLDEVTSAPFPIDATDAHLCVLAARYANDCASVPLAEFATYAAHGPAPLLGRRARMAEICRVRGIAPPTCKDDGQAVARMVDPAWWRRGLRKTHGRKFEEAAIRLGFVSVRAGAYASDETVARRMSQVARNRAALEAVKITNDDGYSCTLADAASKTTSNKRIRRGELMLRLAGCEAISHDLKHVGVFVTITAPSKYHAVIQKSGTLNAKYRGATPRAVQSYLQKVWARIRAAYGRVSIRPYGFRIAEPHHDGCVHWHMLLFMRPCEVDWFCCLVEAYALAEDGDEPGAQSKRVQFERIDPDKGSAAAYLSKYISKNIDDDSAAAHDEFIDENGQTVKIEMPADAARKASQRVDAWAGVWGIRQFQPIGQPPVTVWRELRRVAADKIKDAPEHVRAAWHAAQREYSEADKETGECELVKPADYAEYIRAQGGVCIGREYRIGVAKEEATVEGRYGVYEDEKPVGVYDRTGATVPPYVGPALFVGPLKAGAVHASTRHNWTRTAARGGFDLPRSPVNNCTASDWPGRPKAGNEWFSGMAEPDPVADFDDCWFSSDEFRHVYIEPAEQVDILERAVASAFDQQARSRAAKTGNPNGSIGAKTQGFGA
jgi:hypothetical protein